MVVKGTWEIGSRRSSDVLLSRLAKTVASSNELPCGSAHEYLMSVSGTYRKAMKKLRLRLRRSISEVTGTEISGVEDDDDIYSAVVQMTDDRLEAMHTQIDEVLQSSANAGNGLVPSQADTASLHQMNLRKCQLNFEDWPIDNSDTPFVPHFERGNKTMPEEIRRHVSTLRVNNEQISVPHPYEDAIRDAANRAAEAPIPNDAQLYSSFEETPFNYVETLSELDSMLQKLANAEEIAVDLENHSYRSFQGFCCLIQISTRKEDFIVDALQLRSHLHRLNTVFSDGSVVKVLHGADMDVKWLERDFGVYIVNLFDTGQAARVLALPQLSLAFLLSTFCNVDVSSKKRFQMADWRRRPLPDDMMNYARSDTHYLLYIYDRLRIQLKEKLLTRLAWERSMSVSLKRYDKPRFDEDTIKWFIQQFRLERLPWRQTRIVRELLRWRDSIARKEDESTGYVLPNNRLVSLSKASEQARTVDGIMKCLGRKVPPLVAADAEALAQLIADAIDASSPLPTSEMTTLEAEQHVPEVAPENATAVSMVVPDSLTTQAITGKKTAPRPMLSATAKESQASSVVVTRVTRRRRSSLLATSDSEESGDVEEEEQQPPKASEACATEKSAVVASNATSSTIILDSDDDDCGRAEPAAEHAKAGPDDAVNREEVLQAIREDIAGVIAQQLQARSSDTIRKKEGTREIASNESAATNLKRGRSPRPEKEEEMIPLTALAGPFQRSREKKARSGSPLVPKKPRARDRDETLAKRKEEFDYSDAPWSLSSEPLNSTNASDHFQPSVVSDKKRFNAGAKKASEYSQGRRTRAAGSMSYTR